MRLECTYICVTDMQKSLDFYQKILQQKPNYQNERWAQFDIGHCLALYNSDYDLQMINSLSDTSQYYNQEYKNHFQIGTKNENTNIILNFVVEDLKKEYERIKTLDIGEVSPLYYINIFIPYWYFTIHDPDGNELEITGAYYE